MSGKPAEFHPEALADAEATVVWYRERSLRAAEALDNELEKAIQVISETPERWPLFEAGTRRFPLRRFPYYVIYCERARSIGGSGRRAWSPPTRVIGELGRIS